MPGSEGDRVCTDAYNADHVNKAHWWSQCPRSINDAIHWGDGADLIIKQDYTKLITTDYTTPLQHTYETQLQSNTQYYNEYEAIKTNR